MPMAGAATRATSAVRLATTTCACAALPCSRPDVAVRFLPAPAKSPACSDAPAAAADRAPLTTASRCAETLPPPAASVCARHRACRSSAAAPHSPESAPHRLPTTRDPTHSTGLLLNDYPRTLFPLSTTRVIAERWGQQALDYVYQKVLNPSEPEHAFLAQARCYSSKQGFHLRRTVKLDPVAELFIYDLVYRNRLLFRKDFRETRRSFGYRFEKGEP